MKTETVERINALSNEIQALNIEINKKQQEIDELYISDVGNFEGSYVEYFDGNEYTYMKVKRQTVHLGARGITLYGPIVCFSINPLPLYVEPDDVLEYANYYEDESLFVSKAVLSENGSLETIRKISEDEMKAVCDKYRDAVYKNMLH